MEKITTILNTYPSPPINVLFQRTPIMVAVLTSSYSSDLTFQVYDILSPKQM